MLQLTMYMLVQREGLGGVCSVVLCIVVLLFGTECDTHTWPCGIAVSVRVAGCGGW